MMSFNSKGCLTVQIMHKHIFVLQKYHTVMQYLLPKYMAHSRISENITIDIIAYMCLFCSFTHIQIGLPTHVCKPLVYVTFP